MVKVITTDIYKKTNIDYIYHLGDIHIPNDNARHNEYREVFELLYAKLKNNKKTNSLIVIAGDIIDKGDKITPDCINLVKEFFLNLSNIFPTVIIAGNHDDNVRGNDTKTDSITAILKDNHYKNLYYLNETAVFNLGTNIAMGVITVFDERMLNSEDFPTNNRLKVAVYHGMVESLSVEQNHNIPSGDYRFTSNDFAGYDMVLLGDIHKFYYLNDNKTIAYCGSLIQQSHGEHLTQHGGCIKWDLNQKKSEFIPIHNDYGFITVNYKDGLLQVPASYPKISRVRVKYLDTDYIDSKIIKEKFNLQMPNTIIEALKIDYATKSTDQLISNYINDEDLFQQYLDTHNFPLLKQQKIIDIHNGFISDLSGNEIISKSIWKLRTLTFKNMLCYQQQQTIDFENLSQTANLWGILGKNAQGKSSILKILLFALFGKIPDTPKEDIVNKSSKNKSISTSVEFSILDVDYKVTRTLTTVKLFKRIEDWQNISDSKKTDTEDKINNIIGDIDTLINTSISLQEQHGNLINSSNSNQLKILKKILSLDIYDIICKQVKDIVKQLKKEYEKLDEEVDNDNQIIATKSEKNLAIAKLQQEKEELDVLIENDNKKQEFTKLSKKQNTLEKTIAKLSTNNVNLAESGSELVTLTEEIATLETQKDALLSQITPIDKKLSNFNKNKNDKDIETQTAKKNTLVNDLNNITLPELDETTLQQDFYELSKSLKSENISNLADINKENKKLSKYNSDVAKLSEEYQELCNFLETNSELNSDSIKSDYLKYQELLKKLSKLQTESENINHSYQTKLNLLNKDTFKYNVSCQECQHNKKCAGITKLEEDISSLSNKLESLNLTIKNLATEIESKQQIEKTYQDLLNLEKEVETKNKQHSKLETKLDKLKLSIEKIEIIIDNFNSNQENKEYNKTIKIKLDELSNQLSNIKEHNSISLIIEKTQIKIDKLLNLTESYQNAENTIKQNKEYETQITKIKKNLANKKENYQELELKINEYHKNQDTITQSKTEIQNLATEINLLNYNPELDNRNLKSRLEKICGNLGITQNDLDKIQLLESTINQKTLTLNTIRTDLDNYKSYENITNWSGYPIFLIKKKLNILEIQINRILSIGAHFKCKVVLDEEKSTLIFYNIINDKQVPIKNCSGYEKFILSIAIRMGLITISNYMTPNFFIIDEGFGTMDHNNQHNIDNLFDNLKTQFELIFVITHIDELKQKIPNKLLIDNYQIQIPR